MEVAGDAGKAPAADTRSQKLGTRKRRPRFLHPRCRQGHQAPPAASHPAGERTGSFGPAPGPAGGSSEQTLLSHRLIAEDNEGGLFTVTLFRKVIDDFKTKAKENK